MEENVHNKENKILIADDDENVRFFLEKFLKQKGYSQIHSVATGEEALKAVEKDNIKLVLLDIRLLDMDGIDVLRKIKKMNKNISVIMITAFPDEELTKEAMKEGACDYIIKPFDLAQLKASVANKIKGL
ncbi:MAG: response regulator [Candidatus Omnitrophota bacterium]